MGCEQKGLRCRNSPMCTLSQNGYGDCLEIVNLFHDCTCDRPEPTWPWLSLLASPVHTGEEEGAECISLLVGVSKGDASRRLMDLAQEQPRRMEASVVTSAEDTRLERCEHTQAAWETLWASAKHSCASITWLVNEEQGEVEATQRHATLDEGKRRSTSSSLDQQ
jgi:hypothetical protein